MSLVKKLSYHDDLLLEKEKIHMNNDKTEKKELSVSQDSTDYDLEKWKKSQSTELAILKDWLKKQPHLPQNIRDEHFLIFLHSCYYSIEQAKAKVDSYFTIRTHAPEIFTNRIITSKEIQKAQRITRIVFDSMHPSSVSSPMQETSFKNISSKHLTRWFKSFPNINRRISPLRCATPEGYNAIFVDSVDPDVANFSFTEAMKVAGIAIDVLVRCYPKEEGNILVFDMQRSALAHVIKTNLTVLKKAMIYVEKALPFRLKQVHVINAFPLIQQIQMLVKPFIDDKMGKMIHIHMQDNMETFYNYIPKKSLPKEYGGEAESLEELNGMDKLNEMIHYHEAHLKELEALVVDESKRTGRAKTSNDVFGMEGSFRKLEID